MNDVFDYQEIEAETIQMRMFAQILGGQVKKWFKGLTPNSVRDLPSLHKLFINKWEVKKNPLQILSEYEKIKRNAALDSTIYKIPSLLT